MKIRTIKRVLDWFDKYQPTTTEEERKEYATLYIRLIDEERKETLEAIDRQDIVEYLDGMGDLIWVSIGYAYFADKEFLAPIFAPEYLDELIEVIADSNFTKSLVLQEDGFKKGKVVKGENFVSPKEGILKLIDKYKITLDSICENEGV